MRLAALAVLLAATAATPAAAQTAADLMKCITIARDADRLACYDAAVAEVSPQAKALSEQRAKETARIAAEEAAAAEAAAKAKADAEAYLATAAATVHAAKVERALVGAVNVTVAARALDVAVGADDDAIKAALDKLKADVPGLFSTTAAAPTPGSDPGNPPAAKDTRLSAREEAKAWAEQRYGKRN